MEDESIEEISESEVLEKLKRIQIPDTRKLQSLRIASIGSLNPMEAEFENCFHKSSDDYKKGLKNLRTSKRILLLNEEKQKAVYSLSIPFSFPAEELSRNFDGQNLTGTRMWFNNWQGCSPSYCSPGINATSQTGLQRLIELFSRNKIPIKLNRFNPSVRGMEHLKTESIIVPYSTHVGDCWGDYDAYLTELQFLVFNHPLEAISYIAQEDTIHSEEQTEIKSHIDTNFRPGMETSRRIAHTISRRIYCDIATFSLIGTSPESRLQEMINKGPTNERKSRSIDIKTSVLYMGKPVVVYNPEWIS